MLFPTANGKKSENLRIQYLVTGQFNRVSCPSLIEMRILRVYVSLHSLKPKGPGNSKRQMIRNLPQTIQQKEHVEMFIRVNVSMEGRRSKAHYEIHSASV